MKTKLLILLLLFISLRTESQIADNINWRAFSLMSINPKLDLNLHLGIDKKIVISQLGVPTKITHLNWETLTEDVDEYLYGKNILYIDVAKENLWGFVIKNTIFSFKYRGRNYNIGMSIDNLKHPFPKSYLNRKDNYIVIKILSDKGELAEGFLYFLYNSSNIITEIGFVGDED